MEDFFFKERDLILNPMTYGGKSKALIEIFDTPEGGHGDYDARRSFKCSLGIRERIGRVTSASEVM